MTFTAPNSGMIVPNNMLDSTAAARAMTGMVVAPQSSPMSGTVRLIVGLDDDKLTAQIQEQAIGVSLEVHRAGAQSIVKAAKAETLRDLGRSRM